MRIEGIPFLRNIGLMMTYKCNTACPHCIVEAGPDRTEGFSFESMKRIIQQISEYNNGYITGLALTGGEPFYDIPLLQKVTNYANERGLLVSVVSNAFWAHSEEAAIRVLRSLPGVRIISFSTDRYHRKAVPFDYICNAARASGQCNIVYSIAINAEDPESSEYTQLYDEVRAVVPEDRIRVSITFPVGRAKKTIDSAHYRTSPKPCPSRCTMGSSPVIFPDGNIYACIGPVLTVKDENPLMLGNIGRDPLETILDNAEKNIMLHAIRIWGPGKIITLLKKNGYSSLLPDDYICDCICDACYKIVSNKKIMAVLPELLEERDFVEEVAYGRAYFLDETSMVKAFAL